MKSKTKTEKLAVMLAAAYWRGRLDTWDIGPKAKEAMIDAAANAEVEKWLPAARHIEYSWKHS